MTSTPPETRHPTAIEIEPYIWTFHNGHTEHGYRIFKGRQFLWVRPQEAYEICAQLADHLDTANEQDPTRD